MYNDLEIYRGGKAIKTYNESKRRAFKGPLTFPCGGGIRSIIALRTLSTPRPDFAEICNTSAGSMPKVAAICAVIRSGSAAGRSICTRISHGVGCEFVETLRMDLVQDGDNFEPLLFRHMKY
jgi:hypothetical protein